MSRSRTSEISPLEQVKLRQSVTRRFVPHLTASECVVLDYIFDRTIMWGRYRTRIPISEFDQGNPPNGPLPLSRRTILKALSSLQKKEVLIATGNQNSGKSYQINFEWPPSLVVPGGPTSPDSSPNPDIQNDGTEVQKLHH